MAFIWKKQFLIGGASALLTLGLFGCGKENDQNNEGNNGSEENQPYENNELHNEAEHDNNTVTPSEDKPLVEEGHDNGAHDKEEHDEADVNK